MANKRGIFISFEGVEGVGKSTAIQYVCEELKRQKVGFVLTREPGGTPLAEAIREILLAHYDEKMSSDTELLLMFAGRAQNIKQVIEPALNRGCWVVSDRFTDASFAYQGGGRGVSAQHIQALANWVQGDLKPDMTFLLDVPVEVGLERMKSRGFQDRIEIEDIEFFKRVRRAYLLLAKSEPQRFTVINASQSLENVKENILTTIRNFLKPL